MDRLGSLEGLKDYLDFLYERYNKREFVHPDPLEFLYHYDSPEDQEIVGLIATSVAYGRVSLILKTIKRLLHPLGPSPRRFIEEMDENNAYGVWHGITYRFHNNDDLISLLLAIKKVIISYNTIKNALNAFYKKENGDFLSALSLFSGLFPKFPQPSKGSACKRLFLFLRWMIRDDEVDIGFWNDLFPAEKLLVPLDTHLFRIAKRLGLTKRNGCNINTAIEITEAFRAISPNDPVKYDFVLTRFGINPNFDKEKLFVDYKYNNRIN